MRALLHALATEPQLGSGKLSSRKEDILQFEMLDVEARRTVTARAVAAVAHRRSAASHALTAAIAAGSGSSIGAALREAEAAGVPAEELALAVAARHLAACDTRPRRLRG